MTPDPSAPLDLDEIERVANAATPGPYFATQSENQKPEGQWSVGLGSTGSGCPDGWERHDYMLMSGCCREADAQLFASARQWVPRLTQEVRRLHEKIEDGVGYVESAKENEARTRIYAAKLQDQLAAAQETIRKLREALEQCGKMGVADFAGDELQTFCPVCTGKNGVHLSDCFIGKALAASTGGVK